jgi:poly(3-hydroxybutyrate) depolymerase
MLALHGPIIRVPPTYEQQKPLPLVIMLFGIGGSSLNCQRETEWSAKADAEGFIVVHPAPGCIDDTWTVHSEGTMLSSL